jgi:nucleotide-binding universal stress UspA family protein
MALGTLSADSLEAKARPQTLNVVLAYDGSQHAQAAVALAEDLFHPCAQEASPESGSTCRLTAMTVLPTQNITHHETMQRSLDEVTRRLQGSGIHVEAILKAGTPAASLNAYAAEIGANLIVIGAQGLRATMGILLGGVAQQVVEYSTCPVLVVRAPYQGIRRVLAVIDGSPHSRRSLEYLVPTCPGQTPEGGQRCSWLPSRASVTVMHVLPAVIPYDEMARAWTLGPEVLYPAPIQPVDVDAMLAEEEAHGMAVLREAEAIFASAGMSIRTLLKRGDAATQILETAKNQDYDLIVCGSRGVSPVTSWLLGSVSRKLVHYAQSSVLIVKS